MLTKTPITILALIFVLTGCIPKSVAIKGHYDKLIEMGRFEQIYEEIERDAARNGEVSQNFTNLIKEYPEIIKAGIALHSAEGYRAVIDYYGDKLRGAQEIAKQQEGLKIVIPSQLSLAEQSYEEVFGFTPLDLIARMAEVEKARMIAALQEEERLRKFNEDLNEFEKNETAKRAELNWSIGAIKEKELQNLSLDLESEQYKQNKIEIAYINASVQEITYWLNALEMKRAHEAKKARQAEQENIRQAIYSQGSAIRQEMREIQEAQQINQIIRDQVNRIEEDNRDARRAQYLNRLLYPY